MTTEWGQEFSFVQQRRSYFQNGTEILESDFLRVRSQNLRLMNVSTFTTNLARLRLLEKLCDII